MTRPFRFNLNYHNFNKIALFLLLALILFGTGAQATPRKIISIEAVDQIRYTNKGDEVEILYHFKTSKYEPGEAPEVIELYKSKKLELFELRELLIGRATYGPFYVNSAFSHYIKASMHERKMKVVISKMNRHKEGYYQLRISDGSGTSFLNHTTVIMKQGDACTDALHGPLNTSSDIKPWPSAIKAFHLCPPEGVTYTRGAYCIKNYNTTTEFRFAFEYYDHSKSYPTTAFILEERTRGKSSGSWNSIYIIGVNVKGQAYNYGAKDAPFTTEAYSINDGIAFTLDFKNSSECVTDPIVLTMRKVGVEDIEKFFIVKRDCLKNDCKTPATVLIDTEAPTTSDYTPEHTSAMPQQIALGGCDRQSAFGTVALLVTGLLAYHFLTQ